ncbi:MAG: fibronectin type III domain-containing protein [Candidatus Electrothrix aestuarii]|uniref:Fibronectin type III domain-containing protein n=1 Tax=Candidatus Electrothrix aestuarii TaxID=3062594 RepID=A0AAU8LSP9_9BACT|nr:fibronectin type III domain-containing protein [Candidatus Electrothrix aestuarii]
MRFPNTEAKIIALAQKIIAGLKDNPNFPNPPFTPDQLQASLDKLLSSSDAQVKALAAAKQATDTKQTNLDEMITEMKTVIHYADDTVHGDDAKLSELGWGGRAEPRTLQVPGQPRLLEVQQQGAGWLTLDWKKPADSGTPASYRIERRELSENGTWALAGIALETESTLKEQKHGKEWEYRIIALNKTGDSEPSNTVTAVL